MAIAFAALGASAPAASGDVVLNEINCDDEAEFGLPDWIEVKNTGALPADVTGWRLSDDPLPGGDFYTFPNPTVIAAGDELTVDRDNDGDMVVEGFSFGISCTNDTIRLANPTPTLLDQEALPAIDLDLDTWGRLPDGTGDWRQTFPTKGAANEPSPSGIDLAAPLFDPSEVAQVELGLPPDSVAALSDPETWEDYQDGTLTITLEGEAPMGPMDVGVRLKGGAGSFRPLSEKAAFKVKLPHSVPGQRLLGLRVLTLNNMVQDQSMLHELLAYESFRALGVSAPRTGYAYVRVNGSDYGLYLHVETLDDVSLSQHFTSTQHLYEGEYGADVKPGGTPIGCVATTDLCGFDIDEGSESNLSDLEGLIEAVNGAAPADFSERVAATADLEQMTRMWAVEKYIGHWDGYAGGIDAPTLPNNYYLHSDASGRFSMLPWGTDQTFVESISFDGRGSELFDRCLEDPSCFEMFRNAVQSTRNALSDPDLDALAVDTAALLSPYQAADPRRPYTTDQIAVAVAATRGFLSGRPGAADAWLNPSVRSDASFFHRTPTRKSCPKGKHLKNKRCVRKKRKSRRS